MPLNRTDTRRQRGAALLVSLCVMLVLMIIGVSATRTALNAEKAARAERDRHVAFQAAEAALADAEKDIESGGGPGSDRAAMFAEGSAVGFAEGCGAGSALGLCSRAIAPALPAWQRAMLAEKGSGGAGTVEYGSFTGAGMPVGKGTLPSRLPRYIIEPMPYARAGEDAGKRPRHFYRITAIGFGADELTRVVLQSYYLKAAGEGA